MEEGEALGQSRPEQVGVEELVEVDEGPSVESSSGDDEEGPGDREGEDDEGRADAVGLEVTAAPGPGLRGGAAPLAGRRRGARARCGPRSYARLQLSIASISPSSPRKETRSPTFLPRRPFEASARYE